MSKMLGAIRVADRRSNSYANTVDFCRVFSEEMNRLYLLALLLTGDAGEAERCFVQSLEDCKRDTRVFREWVNSWARRTVIQNAIRAVKPLPRAGVSSAVDAVAGQNPQARRHIAIILSMPAFERFCFVMSALEGYSDKECTVLLDCAAGDMIAARTRAIKKFAAALRDGASGGSADAAVPAVNTGQSDAVTAVAV